MAKTQRALVLQGGVALGAFEVGVFKTLYNKLTEEDKLNGEINRPLFDVVIGTSIGAINAAILVGYAKQKGSWDGSHQYLERFWRERLTSPTPTSAKWWQFYGKEAGRRYYSAKEYLRSGARGVFDYKGVRYDERFYDNSPFNLDGTPNLTNNVWHRYSNDSLRRNVEDFTQFPISTTFNEPRLLAVSVDVEEGRVITFDSYEKQGGRRYSVCGDEDSNYTIHYDDGVEIKNIMASACFPVFFDFVDIDGHKFWDGGILSNTPLRELLHSHRDYWHKVRGMEVPELEIYVINVWPTKEKGIPQDYDRVNDRRTDIAFADKTEYDRRTPMVVSDYIELFKRTMDIAAKYIPADQKQRFDDDIKTLMEEQGESVKRSSEKRKYGDLIDGRFKVKSITTIERQDMDGHDVSKKFADFSVETIDSLIMDGQNYENTAHVKVIPKP